MRLLTTLVLALTADAQIYRIGTLASRGPLGDGGPATQAVLGVPNDLALAPDGTIYASFPAEHHIRRIDPAGIITTYAGSGVAGFSGDSGPAHQALFNWPAEIALDANGNLYVNDSGNNRVRRISRNGIVETVAGGRPCSPNVPGPALNLGFCNIGGIAVDHTGQLHIAEMDGSSPSSGQRIWRVSANGQATILAGKGSPTFDRERELRAPSKILFDPSGNLYIKDLASIHVRRPSGTIEFVVSSPRTSLSLPALPVSSFGWLVSPGGMAVDREGNFYFSHGTTSAIYAVREGQIHLFAGKHINNGRGYEGPSGNRFDYPQDLEFDSAGNLFIADGNLRIAKRTPTGVNSTIAGTLQPLAGARAPLFPFGFVGVGIVAEADGSVAFIDEASHQIRRIAPDGALSVVAGSGSTDVISATVPALQAALGYRINAFAGDGRGNFYTYSDFSYRLRETTREGEVRTLIGSGTFNAPLGHVSSVAVSPSGEVYFAEGSFIKRLSGNTAVNVIPWNGSVRLGFSPAGVLHVLALDSNGPLYRIVNGEREIVAGLTAAGANVPDTGVPALQARLPSPIAFTFDRAGNIFVLGRSPFGQGAVWRIGRDGIQTRIAGGANNGIRPADGAPALGAYLPFAGDIAADANGRLYITVTRHIRVLVPETGTGSCDFKLSATMVDVPASGGEVTLDVATPTFICPWSAEITVPWLKPATAGASGNGKVTLRAERNLGDAREAKVSIGNATVTVTQAAGAPLIELSGLIGSAESTPPVRALSPNGLLTLNGAGFLLPGDTGTALRNDEPWPTVLNNVCVLIDDVRAPLGAVRAGSLKFQSPLIEGKTEVLLTVVRRCGLAGELRSVSLKMPYQAAAPEFLYEGEPFNGPRPVLSGRENGESNIGITAYALGLGVIDLPLRILLGDQEIGATAKPLAGYSGYYEVKFLLPLDTPPGTLTITLKAGQYDAPPATLTIQ